MRTTPLPYVDEHATDVAAGPDEVWHALQEVLAGAFAGPVPAAYAAAVGCVPAGATGPRPLRVGSSVPGFRVVAAEPGRTLALEGRHRFSSYALTFRIEPAGSGCVLRAETRAAFPGLPGAAYRLLVLRSGAHVLGVRRLLRSVRRRAEL